MYEKVGLRNRKILSLPSLPPLPSFFSFALYVYVDKIYVAYESERDDIKGLFHSLSRRPFWVTYQENNNSN